MRQSMFTRRLLYWSASPPAWCSRSCRCRTGSTPVRPDLALLAVIYWILTQPAHRRASGTRWLSRASSSTCCAGMVLGQHALGFLVVAFVTHRLQLRMRMFPILHQAATVLLLLALYQFILFWIDGLIGHGYTRLEPLAAGARRRALWPLIVAAGDSLARRSALSAGRDQDAAHRTPQGSLGRAAAVRPARDRRRRS